MKYTHCSAMVLHSSRCKMKVVKLLMFLPIALSLYLLTRVIDIDSATEVKTTSLTSKHPRSRYIIYNCGGRFGLCGGWSDRIMGILMTYFISLATNRKFGIEMTSPPCNLTSYIVPNMVDWYSSIDEVAQLGHKTSKGFHNQYNNRNLVFRAKSVDFDKWLRHDVTYFITNLDYVDSLKMNPRYMDGPLSWMNDMTRDQVVAKAYKELFQLSPSLNRKLTDFISKARPTSDYQLICAQIRVSELGHRSTTLNDVDLIWDFLRQYDDIMKYKVYVTSDSEYVRNKAKTLFPRQIIDNGGSVYHVGDNPNVLGCQGLEKVIYDQHALMTCDVLVLTYSGVGRLAAYIRGMSEGLYCMVDHRLIKCSPSELKTLYNV
ncbi:uncharacterized protein LOC124149291 [Haliotis rufescens]|uniref:uncharacterized protein LOC124149291 n=1 Tax=Haliotis rufescens TaxID=6454 RepID=UPI00201E941C|nr:uncharacterized protein LOC124149291 [Haliotis rufescens]